VKCVFDAWLPKLGVLFVLLPPVVIETSLKFRAQCWHRRAGAVPGFARRAIIFYSMCSHFETSMFQLSSGFQPEILGFAQITTIVGPRVLGFSILSICGTLFLFLSKTGMVSGGETSFCAMNGCCVFLKCGFFLWVDPRMSLTLSVLVQRWVCAGRFLSFRANTRGLQF